MGPSGRGDRPKEEPRVQAKEITRPAVNPTDPTGPLRIGTLSWSVRRRGYDGLTTEPFLSALGQVAGLGWRPDLLLVSGRTLSDEPDARDLAERASEIPVVFEVANHDGYARWLLTKGQSPGLTLLRQSQRVYEKPGRPYNSA
jgi:hypothetical protein